MTLQYLLSEARKRSAAPTWRSLHDPDHEKQSEFVQDESRYLAAICTRRAGKSNGLGYRFFRAAQKHPGSLSPYITQTRRAAYNIMWPTLKYINRKHNIGATFNKSELSITLPNESQIQLFGADTENMIDRLRGPKYPFAAVDEAQAFREHIAELVDDVLTPAVLDYEDGAIALTGTPGAVAQGLFHEICTQDRGWSVHKWSWRDNPYLPYSKKADEFVADLLKRKAWTKDHPTYLREWCGLWVQDLDALVYKFKRGVNVTEKLPDGQGPWFYVLGVDLGYDPDPSAFVLCAYSLSHPKLYVIDTFKQTKMIVSDVAERIKYYLRKHETCKVVVDAGGQGKQIVEEIRQRYAIPMIAAEKQGKSGFIELMNSDFIRGNIQFLEECADESAEEYGALIWDSSSKKREEDSRFANHLADATLYAWRYCYNYAWQPHAPAKSLPHTEEAVDDFWDREAERVEDEKRENAVSLDDIFGI